ncbi:MAG: OmpA family protein, partial [Bdellovibrionales bacterium]|nr:OmpA family protein [Bdellovibrionales bacterium]
VFMATNALPLPSSSPKSFAFGQVPVFDGDLNGLDHEVSRSSSACPSPVRKLVRYSCQESAIAVATLLALLVMVFFAGCSKKSVGPEDGYDGANAGLSSSALDADLARRYGEGAIPMAEGEGIFKDIRFDFDSSSVSEESRQLISYNAEVLKENPGIKVLLEGHCDERGTSDYNLALGQRRSQAVADVLLSYGISRDRMDMISYGAEVPLDPGHSEQAWALNRRVHFTPFRESGQQ